MSKMLPALLCFGSLRLASSEVAVNCGEEGNSDVCLAWQSLMQVHNPNLTTWLVHPASPPKMRDYNRTLDGDFISRMPSLYFKAMRRVATQDFDPFALAEDRSLVTRRLKAASHYKEVPDIFPHHQQVSPKNGDEGWAFFSSAPREDWILLAVVCVVLFLFDSFVMQRFKPSFYTHAVSVIFWIIVAVGFSGLVWLQDGHTAAFDWCTGYFLEWILSMDNLFVFHLVFETYKTPPEQTHRAVFLGIIGAVVIRMVFFMVVSTLLHIFSWIRFPFGLLLIYSGIQAARGDGDDDEDPSDTVLVRGLKWVLGTRLHDSYDPQGRIFIRDKSGRLQVTLLAMVIALLELSDVVFALDSVSAKIAQIPDQYIAFSSTVLAMYGLRAMFFIIKDLVEMFDLLQYGLCLILVFIGIELMFAHYIKLPSATVCILIGSIFFVFTAASVARKRVINSEAETASEDRCDGKDER